MAITITDIFNKERKIAYSKGDVIINAEDQQESIYYLYSGNVKMYEIYEDGREMTLNIFKPGTYFPAMLVLANASNHYYFEALNKVEVAKVNKKKFVDFIESHPDIYVSFMRRILVGMNGLLERVSGILSEKAEQKITSTLAMLARRFGKKLDDGWTLIDLPLTHADIASLAFMARETASYELEKLIEDGIIKYKNKRILIKNE